ncbi:aspartate kinase [Algoriphagus boritolerans]|uniref:Aspartokinase n=2 Tax=Algoriphagus TaxID=246875 RepID=A0A1H5Z8F0_9BACT|nr:aspartate kinase [Algoriphagus boritolerans]SEG32344.1 aspartate kinase [Algoriphagus boritolerans DSM 17298 = JCM 18970]
MAKTVIYKFGGASVKDADSVRNLAEILRNRLRKNLIIVVSAMGKTTNSLESILALKLEGKDYYENSAILKDYHLRLCRELFPRDHAIFPKLENLFVQLENDLEKVLTPQNYDEFYDRIVSFGELVSTRIVAEFLCLQGLIVLWQDAREVIYTNSDFRFAKIDWTKTRKSCQEKWKPLLENFPILTQGFIGSDPRGRTTTLGREGSDFTAAILATCLDAGSVTIWKDVPGVLNADPKLFLNTKKFDELSYREAAEMTYFGASVIHPKTIKPLANASIPLFVKSFLDPEATGTIIHELAVPHQVPTIVLKKDQVLVSFKVTDFTFIEEKHIHRVYEQLQKLKLRVNMLQLSAISISIVIDTQLFKLDELIAMLRDEFEIRYNEGLELLTILHQRVEEIPPMLEGYEALLEQASRNTFQAVRRKI